MSRFYADWLLAISGLDSKLKFNVVLQNRLH